MIFYPSGFNFNDRMVYGRMTAINLFLTFKGLNNKRRYVTNLIMLL